MLVVPRKHVSSTYALEMDEQQAIWKLVGEVRQRLLTGLKPPDGFNIGFNDGLAAGQTVQHAHVHIIYAASSFPRGAKLLKSDAPSMEEMVEYVVFKGFDTGSRASIFAPARCKNRGGINEVYRAQE